MDQIDLGETEIVAKSLKGRPNIAVLLGSGFSVPKGYPVRDKVNKFLIDFDYDRFDISQGGQLYECRERNMQFYSPHQRNFEFCKRIIGTYKTQICDFDYEKFFDFIHSKDIEKEPYKNCANGLIIEEKEYNGLVRGLDNIINQMILQVIKDQDGNIWYNNDSTHFGSFDDDYDSFLRVLSKWSNDYLVDVHTLNHDMLFESFNNRDYIEGKICDGFDEYGSQYYGNLRKDNNEYHCRLERYTGRYNKPIRLYKLHGSFDYVRFYDREKFGCKSKYVKIKKNIGAEDIMKESKSEMEYENFLFAYHADFLTGIFSKIERYSEPFYKKLLNTYKKNLRSAEKLIIIGYGGKDKKINNAILRNYDYKNKSVIIIDLEPSNNLKLFAKKLDATLIQKSVSNINENDLK